VVAQLEENIANERTNFDLPLGFSGVSTGFQRDV